MLQEILHGYILLDLQIVKLDIVLQLINLIMCMSQGDIRVRLILIQC